MLYIYTLNEDNLLIVIAYFILFILNCPFRLILSSPDLKILSALVGLFFISGQNNYHIAMKTNRKDLA